MRLDSFIHNLPNGCADLFDTALDYPEPFNDNDFAIMLSEKAVRDFGGLKVYNPVHKFSIIELQQTINDELWLNKYQIAAYNKLIAALDVSAEDPDSREVRTYGEDVNTMVNGQRVVTSNIGARQGTDIVGATDAMDTNTDTSYESTTGKTTTTTHSTSQAVHNQSSQSAATDSTTTGQHTDTNTRDEHVDTIEKYKSISESEVPDVIKKWMLIKDKGVIIALEKIIVDVLTIPYYED